MKKYVTRPVIMIKSLDTASLVPLNDCHYQVIALCFSNTARLTASICYVMLLCTYIAPKIRNLFQRRFTLNNYIDLVAVEL